MARLIITIDVAADPATWDPHEVAEDILANGEHLPTFGEGVHWFIDNNSETEIQEGTFVGAEWAP